MRVSGTTSKVACRLEEAVRVAVSYILASARSLLKEYNTTSQSTGLEIAAFLKGGQPLGQPVISPLGWAIPVILWLLSSPFSGLS